MAYRPRPRGVAVCIEEVGRRLREFQLRTTGLSMRDQVRALVTIDRSLRDLGVSVVFDAGLQGASARDRILQYLIANVGQVVEADELQLVAGISEYGRRIRELRVQEGYHIATGTEASTHADAAAGLGLRPDQYMLIHAQPDTGAAARWRRANSIRRSEGAAQSRMLQFLLENVGCPVTTEELSYVAGGTKEFARRLRELRTEQGYALATQLTGRPDLRMGEYVLESAERRADPHDRHVKLEIQQEVYARDKNTCIACGWSRMRAIASDPRYLELHHVQHHASGGKNAAENLVVLCSRCHDEVHAGRLVVSWNTDRFEARRPGELA